MKDKQEKEEKEWAEKLERERARTLNKVEKYCFSCLWCQPLRERFRPFHTETGSKTKT